MFKFAAIVSLMLIATWSQADSRQHKKDASENRDFDSGSSMWAASLSCDSCGSECTSACGTRHFRSCCFNYLRRKRGPDAVKFTPHTSNNDGKSQDFTKIVKQKLPIVFVENIPEQWMANEIPSDYRPYPYDDIFENRFFDV